MTVGIDLGTTNSALAWVNPEEAEEAEFPPIRLLDIPQHVEQGVVEPRRVLPSFLFLGDERYVGVYAREQGALVPTRVVSSAKSWLSNPDVDRTARILPWDARDSGRTVSPVEASAEFLTYIRQAWDKQQAAPLAEQNVVITVPASFDEEARELTVAAAEQAGIGRFTLLEEPSAAFYAWIAAHPVESQKALFDGQLVLVCDVGGGTTDFTLIRVSRRGDDVEFTRTAVGKHLLLGGDNLDLTLAWLVESKLKAQLSVRQRSALRRQCAAAKERLLSDPDCRSVEIRVLGSGTSLVGGTLKTEVLREEALELTYGGFLPACSLADRPKEEKRSLFRELGLPYVSDPAITRHLAAFLAGTGAEGAGGPDAILFNGGFFNPEVCRERVADIVGNWYGRRPAVLESRDLDLAVAVGAAYYSYVRTTGAGVLVRGGLPRTYYIGIGSDDDGQATIPAVCLVPRGTENGTTLELDRDDLRLLANRPVSFRLYSSLTRLGDEGGRLVEFPAGEIGAGIHVHAPLHAVLRFGKRTGEQLVPVKLSVKLTEVGTLEIWCESKVSDHRWRLQFELRKQAAAEPQARKRPATVISEAARDEASSLLRNSFRRDAEPPVAPEDLPGRLEQTLGLGRNSWPLDAIRRFADILLEQAPGRTRNAAWEARWLNLCGFCLRPGFGYPGDDFRIEQTRRIHAAGLQFPGRAQNEVEWWIFWGRVAGGLNRNQQGDLYNRVSSVLLPRGSKRVRVNPSLLREMWRMAAALELLPAHTKTELGEALMARVRSKDYGDSELWCLSRIGARQLFYGPANQVLTSATASSWVKTLLPLPKSAEALAAIARRTGDPTRDLPAATIAQVRQKLEQGPDAARLTAILEGEAPRDEQDLSRVFGEQLPSGLRVASDG
ncbi:MAG: hsp70 family protein [Bryobacteraceae bacterium]|nr:hsp70 family protein [Bryobacteraceae bacterium]